MMSSTTTLRPRGRGLRGAKASWLALPAFCSAAWCAVVLISAAVLPASLARAATPELSIPEIPAAEDRPELMPASTLDEAQQDRHDAAVLFAAARAHEQRQDFPAALRLYERAAQASPGTPAILRHIIVLAFSLDRRAEATRYAQLLVKPEPDDAALLRRIGLELAEEGDLKSALALYQRVAAIEPDQKKVSPNTALWWMEIGRLYFFTEQFALAADEFTKVERALANPTEYHLTDAIRRVIVGKGDVTYRMFGECYLEAGRLDEAMAAFEEANRIKSRSSLLSFNRARVAAHRNDPTEALAQLETALSGDTAREGTEPFELLAKLLTDLGRQDELIDQLKKLHAAQPDNMSLTFVLAETYRKAGKLELAEPLFRELCDPKRRQASLDAWQGYVALLHSAGRWDDLLPVVGTGLGLAGNWEALDGAGKALLADQAAVEALLEVASRQRQAGTGRDDVGRWLAAGMLAIQHKQYDLAGEYLDLALAAAPTKTVELLLTWGMELLTHEQYVQAADLFRRGTQQPLTDSAAAAMNYYLAGALAMADRTDEALAAAQKAAELQPDSPRFQSRVGWVSYHAKRFDDARAAYEELIARFENHAPVSEVRDLLHDVRMSLSNIAVYQNQPDRSEAWLEEVWDEYPDDPGVLNDLGYSWADQGRHLERSLRMVREAAAAEPKNMAYRDSLGWALYRLGKFPEAVAELRAANDVAEPDPAMLDHLAEALLAAKQSAEACDVWKRAAEGFEKEGEIDKARKTQTKIDAAQASLGQPAQPAAAATP
jgi:tetratricopeptide (TPR) repeat protein